MIARLEGVLREQTPTRVIVDVGGVGYAVLDPALDLHRAAGRGQDGRAAHPHPRARGRASSSSASPPAPSWWPSSCCCARAASGPRLAQTVLSGITPAALLEAIRGARIATLRAVPGVGAKLAERILLELRDRVDELALARRRRRGAGRAARRVRRGRARADPVGAA